MRLDSRSPSEDVAAPPLWPVLMRSWLRVLIVSGLVGAMTFVGLTWQLQPQYAAVAELEVPAAQTSAAVEALRSRAYAEKLVADLGLARDPAFNAAMPSNALSRLVQAVGFGRPRVGDTAEQRAVATYQRNLRVVSGGSGRVSIEFVAPTPQLSARIVQGHVDRYLEVGPGEAATPLGETVDLEKLAEEVAGADAAVERFRTATGVAAKTQSIIEDKDLAALAVAVAQSRAERDAAEARARTVRQLLDKGAVEGIAEVHPSPALHDLIAERVRIEVQKTTAERSLAAGHPRIRDLQVKLSELRWQMFREATTIAEALEKDAVAAATREGDARTRLDHANAGAREVAGDAAKLAALERAAADKRRAFEVARSGSGNVGVAALVAPVEASPIAVSRKGPLALLAAVSTLMIGFVLVIIRELVAGGRRGSVAAVASSPIATQHRTETSPAGRSTGTVEARAPVTPVLPSTMPEARPAQFAALSSSGDAARYVAAVASTRSGYRTLLAGDGDNLSSDARDLVSTLASSGRRSVLVDWSRDGTGVATLLGLLPEQPGINDLLAGRATFEDVIARLPGSDAHVVACGSPDALGAPLDPDWINLVLDALDEAYDHIVVVSRLEPARTLFEVIEGRFDAGIVIPDGRSQGVTINAAPGVFLGFEVTDMYVIQLDAAKRGVAQRRLRRVNRQAAVA